MPVDIKSRWIQIRVDEDSGRATLSASADLDGRSATASRELELPKSFYSELRGIIKEHAAEVDRDAMSNVLQSHRIDQGAAPDNGVKAIKIDARLSTSGDADGRKN